MTGILIVGGSSSTAVALAAMLQEMAQSGVTIVVVDSPAPKVPEPPVFPIETAAILPSDPSSAIEQMRRRNRRQKDRDQARRGRRPHDRRAVYGSGRFFGRP